VRDSDFDQIGTIDRGYRRCAENILAPELRPVAAEFSKNVERVIAACLLPSFFANSIASLLHRHSVSHGLEPPMSAERVAKRLKGDASEDRLRIASRHMVATSSVEYSDRVEIALAQALPNAVVGIWTAFEVVARGLWIGAYDSLPVAFKTLDGNQLRIESRTPPLRKLTGQPRSLPRKQMALRAGAATSTGEQLASSVDLPGFASLPSMRKTYCILFSELHRIRATCTIDSVLANKPLEFIGLTRHVLVHKAGIVDLIHSRRSKTMRGCPRFHVGQVVPLDGSLTKAIINHVIEQGTELAGGVDRWVLTARNK
jgi:hypothetical protein